MSSKYKRKKNMVPFHPYEAKDPYEKTYIRLAKSLIMDKNFIELSNSAKVLYIYMKLWAYPKQEFQYTIKISSRLMSKNTFLKSVAELVQKGFIKITWCNRFSHQPNQYEFSYKWYKD